MTRKNRTVADRQESLKPAPSTAHFTLAGVKAMYEGFGGQEFHCNISRYCRTQVFEFPGIDFHPDGYEPHHEIYSAPTIRACVATDLEDYFVTSGPSRHYGISPSLRHVVSEAATRIKQQQKGRVPVFLVIEESSPLLPVEMVSGECCISDEVVVRDGERVPILVGGREGEQFISAYQAIDGAWPELRRERLMVNMILAGVRAGQRTAGPIRKHIDEECLVTDDGRFVVPNSPRFSSKVSTLTVMDATEYGRRISEIRDAIASMVRDASTPHIALLFDAMYTDEYGDDSRQRLQYLGLWESLVEAGEKHLDYGGESIRYGQEVIAGKRTLEELTNYRHDVAHWWTDSMDEAFLTDLQLTVNELVRRKYF